MSRYIDAEEFKNRLREKGIYPVIVKNVLENMPTADIVEVVQCKDCKYFGNAMGGGYYKCNGEGISLTVTNAFCSYGERKN